MRRYVVESVDGFAAEFEAGHSEVEDRAAQVARETFPANVDPHYDVWDVEHDQRIASGMIDR